MKITREMIVIIEDEKLVFFIERIIYVDSLDCYFISKRAQICFIAFVVLIISFITSSAAVRNLPESV